MIDGAITADPRVADVLARFPGAQVVEVRRHQPRPTVPVTEKVTFQDLWLAAESERARAEATRKDCVERANESDQKNEAERNTLRRAAAERARTAEVFEAMARMIERVRDSRIIRDELAYIARQIASDAADRAADAGAQDRE